mgnify:CR=1 FL=1
MKLTTNPVAGAAQRLTAETRARIDRWVAKFPAGIEGRRSAVIQSLMAAQEQNGGSLDDETMNAIADYLELPATWVYEVASFYSLFDLERAGRHKISICTNVSCMLRGAEEIVEYAEKKLGIKLGETTADGRVTLKVEEECLAACCGAPMMVVDGHYHENLTTEKIDSILNELS